MCSSGGRNVSVIDELLLTFRFFEMFQQDLLQGLLVLFQRLSPGRRDDFISDTRFIVFVLCVSSFDPDVVMQKKKVNVPAVGKSFS